MQIQESVAIVGFGGVFPGGPDVEAFWRNVSRGVDAGRSVPPDRWILPPEQACRPGSVAPDKTYSTWCCTLDEIPLPEELRQGDPALLDGLDPVCHLALTAASQAVQSVRWNGVDKQRVGVILGHIVLPTEATSAMARDVVLRTFEERVLDAINAGDLRSADGGVRRPAPNETLRCASRLTDPRNRRIAALPAEIIAEWYDFGGPAFTLDAACASSLYALKLAVDELLAGRMDVMLAGGLSRPDCQYTQIGFAQLQALSKRGRCAPFSSAADGLVVGEGAGLFVLKRLSDAIAAGDRIEAVIAGIGLSNDRGANLLAPHSEGQLRAMRAAYERAGWAPEEVDYIECHATGTPTGDAVELDSLHQLWRDRPSRPGQCALGAVKSNVGHLLTGAGAAGLMKLIGMLRAREFWPIANFAEPAAALRAPGSPFRVAKQAEPWPEPKTGRPRRAAINAFGFGGINAHVLIEEYVPAGRFAVRETPSVRTPDEIVIIGIDAAIGPWRDLDAIRNRLLGPDDSLAVSPPHCWGADASKWFTASEPNRNLAAFGIPQTDIPVGEFRIPPVEIPDMLPEQQLMLTATANALDQAGVGRSLGDRTGVFLGVSLDPNTTNFHCRWAIAAAAKSWGQQLGLELSDAEFDAWVEELRTAFGPPLTANRVMGNLAAITASRIAREFDVGGPSFTIAADEDSGLRAVEIAVRALERVELDVAIVGAVEFGSDIRAQLADLAPDDSILANDGAIAFVLKRRSDAERDGNPVLAKLRLPVGFVPSPLEGERVRERGFCSAESSPPLLNPLPRSGGEGTSKNAFRGSQTVPIPDPAPRVGFALATAGMTRLLHAALCLTEQLGPDGALCLRDRRDGPRQIAVPFFLRNSTILLEEVPSATRPITATRLSRWLFPIEGDDRSGLLFQVNELESELREADSIEIFAHEWIAAHPLDAAKPQAIVLIGSSREELFRAIGEARRVLQSEHQDIHPASSVFYAPTPLGIDGKLAFVFPGSGNAFLGMGRDLLSVFPGVLQRQSAENEQLAGQYRPNLIWDGPSNEVIGRDHKAMIFGQVSLGTAICDLLAAFGVRPAASIGYSLGESAALFGLRAWRDRDEMLDRMRHSPLFGSHLVHPFDAARKTWLIPSDEPVPWISGVVTAPADAVRKLVSRKSRAYLLIINTPTQCVIGGDAEQIADVVRQLGASFVPFGSPSTVHCPILKEVSRDYVALHRMTTTPPGGIDFYSSATGERYGLSQDAAAGAILAQAVDTVDFPRVIRNAYRDGVRLFLEIGPGNSCTRMIDEILSDRPHWAGAACPATSDPVGQFLNLLAQLIAHRVPVDPSPLYSPSLLRRLTDTRSRIITPVGHAAFAKLPLPRLEQETCTANLSSGPLAPAAGERARERGRAQDSPLIRPSATCSPDGGEKELSPAGPLAPAAGEKVRERGPNGGRRIGGEGRPGRTSAFEPPIHAFAGMLAERAETHSAFLRFAHRSQQLAARLIAPDVDVGYGPLAPAAGEQGFSRSASNEPPRSLNYGQCLEFAIGKIGDVLGPRFAEIDEFPTRVRLPDVPLMLCHRILEIEGEALSMSHGRLVTEHDISPDAWYLDCGRIPTCIAVEAGQADLFLSSWLGIDFETRGLAVYRLLDAVVTFHDELPGPGSTIRYDIRINRFFRQGETWLFRFEFDATVNGRPLLTMREGCAGFFTAGELASGKGIVQTALDRQPRPGKRSDDWTDPVPMTVESYTDAQLTALRSGDLASCFGSPFRGLPIANPATLPDGQMRLIDRVLHLDPSGGKYGLGLIRAEADIHPDDWFLTCHFCDDQVMPGTLMYECCLHTLRVYLLRMGWIGEAGEIVYEPIPEIRSRLKCRGQVLATTKKVWYEVTIKEIGYGDGLGPRAKGLGTEDGLQRDVSLAVSPQPSALRPYCLADALMYADGKPIVEMTDMSLRLTGLTRERVESLWSSLSGGRKAPDCARNDQGRHNQGAYAPRSDSALFDTDRITEFAIGKPSQAFGERYRVFDEDRVIARLPGPPFQFLDRIVSIRDCEPWKLAAGGVIVAEYDVPRDAWYFAANRQSTMPFAVLLEAALQPCGWLAAYLGSALTRDVDLSFRNLGGKATQFQAVTPDSGTLTTTVKITSVSQSAGMIIQHYEFDLCCRGEPVYQGATYFGFFSKQALANQIGIRDAARYQPTAGELASELSFPVPRMAPFPSDRFRMVDQIAAFLPDGGPQRLGYLRGTIDVDPAAWFFQAHFYQDPVWPGSLGLESLLQLLKVYAVHRWARDEGVVLCSPPLPNPLPRSGGEGTGDATDDGQRTTNSPRLSFATPALNSRHEWIYRGQVIPSDETVTVEAVITAVDDARRLATATGFLSVDGRVIYQMIDFTVQLTASE